MPAKGKQSRFMVVWALALVVAACGGGDGESSQDVAGTQGNQDQGSVSGDVQAPTIDPSAMPPAGEAHVDVDGQTFVFKQSEMLEGPFACEIREDGITINFQSDGHDLLLQGATQESGEIIARATVAPDTGDNKYSSSAGGAVAAEAPHVVFVATFDASPTDDPGTFNDVGSGTVAVTCP